MLRAILLLVGSLTLVAGVDIYEINPFAACDASRPEIINVTKPGLITSPGYHPNATDAAYPPNSDCTWQINQEDATETLEFKIFDMELECSSSCMRDGVFVYDGQDDTGTELGNFCYDKTDFCGTRQEDPIQSTSNSFFVKFYSDELYNARGFVARYSAPIDMSACTSPPATITIPRGVFMSENYPANYPNNANCQWHFTAPQGEVVTVNVQDFALENCCNCDTLEIFDGGSASSTRFGAWYSNNEDVPTIISSSNELFIRFESDYSVTNSGFYGTYSFAPPTKKE